MSSTINIDKFSDSEKKGLLGKVINYLKTATFEGIPENTPISNSLRDRLRNYRVYYTYSKEDMLTVLHNYFTDDELKLILKKIIECQPEFYKNRFHEYTLSEYGNRLLNKISIRLSEINIRIIVDYLRREQIEYKGDGDMNSLLCGFLGKLRKNRQAAVTAAAYKLEQRLPPDILRYTGEFVDNKIFKDPRYPRYSSTRNTDKQSLLTPLPPLSSTRTNMGGKKKRKTNKKTKRRRKIKT